MDEVHRRRREWRRQVGQRRELRRWDERRWRDLLLLLLLYHHLLLLNGLGVLARHLATGMRGAQREEKMSLESHFISSYA